MLWFKKIKDLLKRVDQMEAGLLNHHKRIIRCDDLITDLNAIGSDLNSQIRSLKWEMEEIKGQLLERNRPATSDSDEDFAVRAVMFVGQDISNLIGKNIVVHVNPQSLDDDYDGDFFVGKCAEFGVTVRNIFKNGKVDYEIRKHIVVVLEGTENRKFVDINNNTSIRLK
jgi:hypothetical protein